MIDYHMHKFGQCQRLRQGRLVGGHHRIRAIRAISSGGASTKIASLACLERHLLDQTSWAGRGCEALSGVLLIYTCATFAAAIYRKAWC